MIMYIKIIMIFFIMTLFFFINGFITDSGENKYLPELPFKPENVRSISFYNTSYPHENKWEELLEKCRKDNPIAVIEGKEAQTLFSRVGIIDKKIRGLRNLAVVNIEYEKDGLVQIEEYAFLYVIQNFVIAGKQGYCYGTFYKDSLQQWKKIILEVNPYIKEQYEESYKMLGEDIMFNEYFIIEK